MSTWARRKQRIKDDPEFAERIRRQQRESAARRRGRDLTPEPDSGSIREPQPEADANGG